MPLNNKCAKHLGHGVAAAVVVVLQKQGHVDITCSLHKVDSFH